MRIPENLDIDSPVVFVIPDWGKAWTIYCLEYAIYLKSKGFDVTVIDFSLFNQKITHPRVFLVRETILKKSSLFNVSKKLCYAHDIEFHRFFKLAKSFIECQFTRNRENVFERALNSKYANTTGLRSIRKESLPRKDVYKERLFFYAVFSYLEAFHFGSTSHFITVNGRYILDSAVVQFAKEKSFNVSLLEGVSATAGKFEIFEKSPHDLENMRSMHLELWKNSNENRNEIAEKGLKRKLRGSDSPGFDWRGNFDEVSEFPVPNGKKIAVYFPSSDREFSIFPEFVYQTSFSGDQHEAFRVFSRVAIGNNYEVIVRVHPVNTNAPLNVQKTFAEVENQIWRALGAECGASVIEAESSVSSYSLMDRADLVATYASSISIEALLIGKNTMILGEFEFSYLFPQFCANNKNQIIDRFKKEMPKFSKEQLYPYGYWLEKGGYSLRIFEFVSDDEVFINGRLINELRFHRLKKLIRDILTIK